MLDVNRQQWTKLHQNKRYRPKYPSEMVVQFVFRNFKRNGNTKILDLGCGAGRHVFFMGNEGIVPYGLDYSDEGIAYIQKMLAEYGMEDYVSNMKVGSITNIPYEDEFFDGIICYGVLYYLNTKEIKTAVHEIKRVLKPGGKLLLVVRNTNDYRFNCKEAIAGEQNTIIVREQDISRCANSENGMLMHFFEEKELMQLFSDFQKSNIDIMTETHDNQQFCDCNYVVTAEK